MIVKWLIISTLKFCREISLKGEGLGLYSELNSLTTPPPQGI
jgi:hypothetical protein